MLLSGRWRRSMAILEGASGSTVRIQIAIAEESRREQLETGLTELITERPRGHAMGFVVGVTGARV